MLRGGPENDVMLGGPLNNRIESGDGGEVLDSVDVMIAVVQAVAWEIGARLGGSGLSPTSAPRGLGWLPSE